MQGIFALARGSWVQALRLTLMATPLCLRDFLFDIAVKVTRLEFLSIASCDRAFQTQIEPDGVPEIYFEHGDSLNVNFLVFCAESSELRGL